MSSLIFAAEFERADRTEVALFTNHGYAGPNVPASGAPDTGGQNFYVNTLALALQDLGFKITIFARGGFPHMGSSELRDRPEYLGPHIRYVYALGGGNEFIRKEEISLALEEELEWIYDFIEAEARARRRKSWEIYAFLNSHYWDAAVLCLGLVERWRNDVAALWLERSLGDRLDATAFEHLFAARHRLGLGRSVRFYLGGLAAKTYSAAHPRVGLDLSAASPETVALAASTVPYLLEGLPEGREPFPPQRLAAACAGIPPHGVEIAMLTEIGAEILRRFKARGRDADAEISAVDRHVWTPHSLGELKERNYWDRPSETKRAFRFIERKHHEQEICLRTPVVVASSEEITEVLINYYGVDPRRTFYFPPCIDHLQFKPRARSECHRLFGYLAERTGLDPEMLQEAKIVFEISRMDPTKRKEVIIQSFEQVAEEVPDAYLFIAGGPQNALFHRLQGLIDSSDILPGRAYMLGFIPEEHLCEMLSAADVFASASEMEGFGTSALEAAASRTALVTTSLTPFSTQYLRDVALIVPPGDSDAFAKAIVGLFRNDADREERAQEAYRRTRSFRWPNMTRSFLAALQELGVLSRDVVPRVEFDAASSPDIRLPATPQQGAEGPENGAARPPGSRRAR